MIDRRRALMLKSAAGPSPVEWDYTDGLPGDNGFTKATTGTQSETLKSNCVELTANGSSSFTRYLPPGGRFTQAEVSFSANASNAQNILVLYDGDHRLAVRFQYSNNYKGLYVIDASAIASMTKLVAVSLNTNYTIKLVISGSAGSIYLNGTLLTDSVDLSTIVSSGDTSLRVGSAGSVQAKTSLFSMKFS